MKKYHARCGLSKKQAKKLKIKHCYLMASVNKDGTIKSVQCYSDSNPTFMVGDTLVRIMETRGSSYQKSSPSNASLSTYKYTLQMGIGLGKPTRLQNLGKPPKLMEGGKKWRSTR